jgi:hydrogenase expression/formation protein HypC
MCLAIPMELVEVDGDRGVVEAGGVRKEIRLTLLEAPAVGDYVIVHAGFAIQKLDKEQAAKDLALLAEVAERARRP